MENDSLRQMASAPVPPSSLDAELSLNSDAPADVSDDIDAYDDAPPDYNMADFRWVPVRRQPRYDGWTDEKQRRFIEVLADTGLVGHAAKTVGMSRESAARLRRSPHAVAFSRAWDAARAHAGSALEDIAFERAIEGAEQHVFNEYGEVVCTKRVYNDRLLTFLLGHLKPERYGRDGRRSGGGETAAPPPVTIDASLRAMEPQLPAPPEELLGAETLQDELEMAQVADGILPHSCSEQRTPKTDKQIKAEALAAQHERGKTAFAAFDKGEKLNNQQFLDMSLTYFPAMRSALPKKLYR